MSVETKATLATAAEALVAQLEAYGVEYIFGTCGHTNIALLDADRPQPASSSSSPGTSRPRPTPPTATPGRRASPVCCWCTSGRA